MEENELHGWLDHIQSKYRSEYKHMSKEIALISESDRILRQFGIKPKSDSPKPKHVKYKDKKTNPKTECVMKDKDKHPAKKSKSKSKESERQELEALLREIEAENDRKTASEKPEPAVQRENTPPIQNTPPKPAIEAPVILEKRRASCDDLRKLGRKLVLRRIRLFFIKWNTAAEDLKDSEIQLQLVSSLILKRKAFARFVIQTERHKAKPRFDEIEKRRRVEALGNKYMRNKLYLKFMTIWMKKHAERRNELRVEAVIVEETKVRKERKPKQIKLDFKKYEFKKKPPAPPIVIDPIGDEMLKNAIGAKEKKAEEIKRQMKAELMAKKELEEKQRLEDEQKRRKHLALLAKQRKERIARCKAEEEFIRKKALEHDREVYGESLGQRLICKHGLQRWRKVLEQRKKQETTCRNAIRIALLRFYFGKMKHEIAEIDAEREADAIFFHKRRLFMKVRSGIKLALDVIKREENEAIECHRKHALRRYLGEWKEARIVKRRRMKQLAIEHYQRMLECRVLKAIPLGARMLRDDEKRRGFRDKLMKKAQELLVNMAGTETLQIQAEIENDEDESGDFF